MDAPPRRVVLVGNPNTGKSTLFGVLSGLHVRTGNYAGVTIEKKVGRLDSGQLPIDLVDLPGTYSLSPRSPDELVAVQVLTGDAPGEPTPDLIVCVVNATLLRRNLFLVSQLLELGRPMIVAVNMIDAAAARGMMINTEQLAQNLGVPVFAVSASKRTGIDALRQAIVALSTAPGKPCPPGVTEDRVVRALPHAFYAIRDELAAALDADGQRSGSCEREHRLNAYLIERAVLDRGGEAERRLTACCGQAAMQRLSAARSQVESQIGELEGVESSYRYRWAGARLDGVLNDSEDPTHRPTDWIDSLLTHRVGGPVFFAALMFLMFQFIYAWSSVPMQLIESAQGWLAGQVQSVIQPGVLRSLIVDGIIGGVGGVLIFVPQIAILFLFLALLEDCGYMARAAFLVDRLMSLFGLGGKSFLPLMSSFACAVPGVMATRVIENRRDRFATIMVAPLMSCSARLPVYLLLISAFVPATRLLGGWVSLSGVVLMSMYLVGVLVAIPVAWLLKRTLLRGESAPFVLEMPEYKVPSLRVVLARVWEACAAFVVRAGTLIFAASIVIWAAAYWPGDHSRQHELQRLIEASDGESFSEEVDAWVAEYRLESGRLLERSLLGQIGHGIEPIVRPLGWDWRIGVGAVASFPAREVIISTLGTIYSLGGDVDEESQGLIEALRESKWPDGRPVYNLAVALSIMVFFALCAQCVSTLLVIKRETNSWWWPLFCFTYMTVLAYLGAFLTYQSVIRLTG